MVYDNLRNEQEMLWKQNTRSNIDLLSTQLQRITTQLEDLWSLFSKQEERLRLIEDFLSKAIENSQNATPEEGTEPSMPTNQEPSVEALEK